MSLTSSHFNHQISSIAVQKKIEVTLLKEGHVEITDLSAMISQKTYAISNIYSVRVHTYEPKLFLSVFFMLVVLAWSASVAMSDMETYSQNIAVSLVMGIGGLIFLILSTKRNTVYASKAQTVN